MKTCLLIVFCFLCSIGFSQEANLQLVKNGRIKKRIVNGTTLVIIDKKGDKYIGAFYIVNDSMLSVTDRFIPVSSIEIIKLPRSPKKPFNWKQFGLVSLGVALSSAGMAASGWETTENAIIYSSVIGYSPYLINSAKKLLFKKRKQWHIHKKAKLRIWDMRLSPRF
jgi:hypothetical protein